MLSQEQINSQPAQSHGVCKGLGLQNNYKTTQEPDPKLGAPTFLIYLDL